MEVGGRLEEEEDYLLHSLSLSPSHLAAEVRLAP